MRPIKLIMKAFGAFKDYVEIPFGNLGRSNIYLISGATGSGKTTIFDAICYALFNTSSGSNRGNQVFRSHYAQDGEESYVDFEFMFNGDIYKIIRYPNYERKKTRGDGFISEPQKALLTLPNGKLIEKVKDVDEFIVNLLGINSNQFSQIALLAQGEFLKLLNTDTVHRGEIFRNIFKTWNFANFQNSLKEKSLLYKNKYEQLEFSILQYIRDIKPIDSELNLMQNTYLSKKCFDDLSNFIDVLEKQNLKDDNELKKIKKEIELSSEQISKLQDEYLKIKQKLDLEIKIKDFSCELDKTKKEISDYLPIYDTLKDKEERLDVINIQIKKTNDDYENSLKIQDLVKDILKLKSDVEIKENQKENLTSNLILVKEDYIKSLYDETYEYILKLDDEQKKFLEKQEFVKEISAKYNNDYNQYLSAQAGIIAKNLKDNFPCPVCGSLVHPKPALNVNFSLTKELIDTEKDELDFETKKLSDISKECSILNEKIQSKKHEIKKISDIYGVSLEDKTYNVSKINYVKKISELEKEILELEKYISEIHSKIVSNNSIIETMKKTINDSIDNILTNYKKLQVEQSNLKKEIASIKNNYDEKNIRLNSLISNLNLLNEQIEKLKDVNTNSMQFISENLSDIKEKISTFDKLASDIIYRLSLNNKIIDSIKVAYREFVEVNHIYNNYKILSDCANGTLKGKIRIPFEQYIQGYYLDMVLCEANKRLKLMTQNQFQLLRKKTNLNMQTKSGLDIEVMDFHTFKTRDTKTLSGGESFKAALCLALGLSDCVSNIQGAINIDAMFIDEGFGSLDSESLELAMDVIFNLSSNNRLIGIISHIEDLKNKIQNQILTVKSDNGSKLYVNF